MRVAENIYLGREPRRAGWFVNQSKMIADATALFARLGFDINPRLRMRSLSVAKVQLVEIAKAISRDSDILIMDEPTSAIGEKETATFFEAIRSLQTHGVGIIYVSHRLTDIFSIADAYTVLRDGRFIETGPLAHIDRERLIGLIIGPNSASGKGVQLRLRTRSCWKRVITAARGSSGTSLSLCTKANSRPLWPHGGRPQRIYECALRQCLEGLR